MYKYFENVKSKLLSTVLPPDATTVVEMGVHKRKNMSQTPNSADAVTCFFEIQYVPPQKQLRMLEDAASMLKRGGILVLMYPFEEQVRAFENSPICTITYNTESNYVIELGQKRLNEYIVGEKPLVERAKQLGFVREQWKPFAQITTRGAEELSEHEISVVNLCCAAVFRLL